MSRNCHGHIVRPARGVCDPAGQAGQGVAAIFGDFGLDPRQFGDLLVLGLRTVTEQQGSARSAGGRLYLDHT